MKHALDPPEQQLKVPAVVNLLKAANDSQERAAEFLPLRLRWLFLAALLLFLWQVPLINLAYYQAGTQTFLQAVFQNESLPPHSPWTGQFKTDPKPMIRHLEQADNPVIPLQMSLNADRPLGVLALMTGNITTAQQRLLGRLEHAPGDYIAQFFLGEAYRRRGNISAAIKQWSTAGAQEPLMELARDLIDHEEKTAALAALEAVIRLNKTDTEPRWWAADILREQGATKKALALYQEIRTINPHSEAAHKRVAEIWLQQGNLDQALAVYQEMINLTPNQATGYALMGQALFEARRFEQAIKFLKQALQRNPAEPDLLLEKLGESYAGRSRWAEAIEVYQQAIELNSNRSRIYVLLGEAQCQVGPAEEARSYFEQAVALGNQQQQIRQAIEYITQQGACPP